MNNDPYKVLTTSSPFETQKLGDMSLEWASVWEAEVLIFEVSQRKCECPGVQPSERFRRK
eukprot:3366587-Karenia_brevis.AAC.1